ncbi:hypothetical protein [Algibacter sp. PT7-4]|uniref:hypothetical protein n=1 Tax=Algibacter ulvanivorans TaxID=3400999 RepID=UPI003AAA94BE
MKKFFKNILVFFFIIVILGELIIRFTHTVSDLPQRTIDEFGIQKYYPNQSGYWKGGDHKWKINKFGWPGDLPNSYENVISIIGDSFIENFMNPNECHQSNLLKQKMSDYNFIEASRSGVSFIEAMEISKQLDSLKPIFQLIYVAGHDFTESVSSIKPLKDITQLDIETNRVVYGQMKSPGFKKILYNWKLLYYFYNNFSFNVFKKNKPPKKNKKTKKVKSKKDNDFKYFHEISKLLNYVKLNYDISNKILVFQPKSKPEIIKLCKDKGFKTILLNSDNDKSWSFDYDHHWTCYGHDKVSLQVSRVLTKYINESTKKH